MYETYEYFIIILLLCLIFLISTYNNDMVLCGYEYFSGPEIFQVNGSRELVSPQYIEPVYVTHTLPTIYDV